MSDFGRGLCYNLGLFLEHAEHGFLVNVMRRAESKAINEHIPETWFNGASDHLFDLEIPKTLPASLQKRLKRFQKKVLNWGHGFPKKKATEKNMEWATQEAKDLLRLIDEIHGIKTKKGDWE